PAQPGSLAAPPGDHSARARHFGYRYLARHQDHARVLDFAAPIVAARTVSLLGMRSRRAKVSVAVASTFVIYLIITWALGKWLELTGWDLWILRGALWVLGAIAAGIVFWFTTRRGGDDQGEAGDDDIDAAMTAARARLAASRAAKTAAPGKLPLVVVLGPVGSAKTASGMHCGLDPDRLAGEVSQGDRIP